MTEALRFDGRVAVVTGAGGGMGRCYALELANRGAAVLVNDYGGSIYGSPGTSSGAAETVEAILRAGGQAIVNTDPVGTAEVADAMVKQAIDAFGRIDLLINNAGIALPGAISDLSFERIERVYRTNVIGPHALIRAAWPYMKAQRHGRIINIASNAALGIGGNTPYAASKAAMIGLALDAAREGAPHGILVNAVMPVGFSRMIEVVPDPEFVEWMRASFQPEKVVNAVLPLLTDASAMSGQIFTIGGGRLARLGFVVNEGFYADPPTPETFLAGLAKASDLTATIPVSNQQDEMMPFTKHAPMGRADGPGLAPQALAT